MAYAEDFEKALQVGRPPNIQALFPNSKALIVSGKVVDRAMRAKGKAMAMAANGRNYFVIRGALRAAQRANAALIIEIAKSEGGQKAYCAVNYWNMARIVDALCNEMGITIPVAIHADHYGIKSEKDLEQARVEIPIDVRRGHHVHRHRRVPPARRPEPAREHRRQPVRSPRGPGWRPRSARSRAPRGSPRRTRRSSSSRG